MTIRDYRHSGCHEVGTVATPGATYWLSARYPDAEKTETVKWIMIEWSWFRPNSPLVNQAIDAACECGKAGSDMKDDEFAWNEARKCGFWIAKR